MQTVAQSRNLALALCGALAGGVLGHFATVWIAHQGFYAMVLPGGLVGLGGGLLARDKSVLRGVSCAVLALAAGFLTDWRVEPFIKDGSLGYYFSHVHLLKPITWLMIVAGAACAYWLAIGKQSPGGGAEV